MTKTFSKIGVVGFKEKSADLALALETIGNFPSAPSMW